MDDSARGADGAVATQDVPVGDEFMRNDNGIFDFDELELKDSSIIEEYFVGTDDDDDD